LNLHFHIQEAISAALKKRFDILITPEQVKIERTIADYTGDYTFVVFPFVKQSRMAPEQTAAELGKILQDNPGSFFSGYSVVKGFLNLELKDEVLLRFFEASAGDAAYLKNDTGHKQKVMVEYSSPNTNKPLHLGHIRNIILGYSIAEILIANDYEVCKANLINDRGIHICKSMLAWK
jgi:arginyl-tRNA synthetase